MHTLTITFIIELTTITTRYTCTTFIDYICRLYMYDSVSPRRVVYTLIDYVCSLY